MTLEVATRRPIRLLEPTLINQIAAGEVIVRPASVVKELVENALDAEATRITISIGIEARDVSVTDDGTGIPGDEIETALLRHATSKISAFDDITILETRGFRGEALASIASVARVRMTSRTPDAAGATLVEVYAGETVARRQVGAPVGTRVEVTDLFENVPARRKFLRSPQSEFNAILRIVVQQALSCPDVGFILERTGEGAPNRVLELPAEQTLKDRLAQVLGVQIGEHLVPVEMNRDDHLISGFVARPLQTRRDARGQFFFVAGRPVANRRLGFALRQACAGMIMSGRHPIAALFIECPANHVDVNVHPTKDEVRFADEDRVAGLVYRAVQAALVGTDLRPRLTLGDAPPLPYSMEPEGMEPSPPMPLLWGAKANGMAAPGTQSAISFNVRPASADELGIPEPPPTPEPQPEPPPPDPPPFPLPPEPLPESTNQPINQSTTVFDPLIDDANTITPLGQIGDSYIVASCGDDMLVIDQHAAHERLMFFKVQQRFAQQRSATQTLLVPLSFDLPATSLSHLDVMIPIFNQLGIEMESFGGQTVLVRSMPPDFEKVDIAGVVLDVASDLERGSNAPTAEAVRDRVLTRMACHAAIKANRRMNPAEMRGLIEEIVQARLPHTCPHGRPTMALLTLEQLDRQFKRK